MDQVLKGGTVKQIFELKGRGLSERRIARTLGISRNTVAKYLAAGGIPKPRPRPSRRSKLDPYVEHIDRRLADGLFNCAVLLRELRVMGYEGGYTILKDYVSPRRQRRRVKATSRFETKPGEQAQVDWGSLPYVSTEGRRRRKWAFVMVMGYSRAIYLQLADRADVATFIACHVNAFEYFGGIPRHCLYDNAKVVVLGRDRSGLPDWNRRMLDFALRLGFRTRLCRPYRAQTKGKVERAIKYVRSNFWPSARFDSDDDLNRQALAWCDGIANRRVHGTTGKVPWQVLEQEQSHLRPLPDRASLVPYLRQDRRVGRDGYVRFDGSGYGVPWRWANEMVQVVPADDTLEIWCGDQRLAIHPRAASKGQRLTLPGQWEGLPTSDNRPPPAAVAVQIAADQVERRPLDIYQQLAAGGGRP